VYIPALRGDFFLRYMQIMINIKIFILLLAILIVNPISAQTTKITQLLQVTLQQENEARKMVYTEIDSLGNEIGLNKQDIDSLEVAELAIQNDTLFYTTKHHFAFEKGYYLDQQIVALKDVIAVTKDIGIFFETAPDKVQFIRKEYFEDGNSIKTSRKELSGSTSAAMSQKTACAIDSAISKTGIKVGTKASAAMSSQAKKESLSKLIFKIEF